MRTLLVAGCGSGFTLLKGTLRMRSGTSSDSDRETLRKIRHQFRGAYASCMSALERFGGNYSHASGPHAIPEAGAKIGIGFLMHCRAVGLSKPHSEEATRWLGLPAKKPEATLRGLSILHIPVRY